MKLPGTVVDSSPNFEFPTENTENPLNFEFEGPTPSPISESAAAYRASKYDYALGTSSPGQDQLKYAIQSGTEDQERLHQTQMQRVKDQEIKLGILRDYAADRGGVQHVPREDIEAIMTADAEDVRDPSTFFEKLYARKMFADATILDVDPEFTPVDGIVWDDGSVYSQAYEEDPVATEQLMSAAERIQANNELDNKLIEDYTAQYEQMGWGSWTMNSLESLTPFLSQYRLSNVDGIVMLGNDLEEQYARLNELPVTERHAAIKARVAELWDSNPQDALVFLNGLRSFTGTDKFLNNSLTVIDASIIAPGVGVLPLRGSINATAKLGNMLKSTLSSAKRTAVKPSSIVAATGNIQKAGLLKTLERMRAAGQETSSSRAFVEVMDPVPTVANPSRVISDKGWASSTYADQLADVLTHNSNTVLSRIFLEASTSARLSEGTLAAEAGKQAVKDTLNVTFGKGNDVVIDIQHINPESTLANTNFVRTLLGNKGTDLFDSPVQAAEVARDFYGLSDVRITEIGSKYAIELRMPVDETAVSVRKAMRTETVGATPQSIATMFLPGLRSADDKISARLAEEAKSAMMGGAELAALGKQLMAPISKLSRKSYDDLNRFMNFQRDYKPKGGERGVFSDTLAQFGTDWQKMHGRLPTENEATAYFTARQLNDLGWVVTNFGLYRDKTRLGFELFDFGTDASVRPTIEGKRVTSKEIFEHVEDAGILVLDDPAEALRVGANPQIFRTKYMGKKADGSPGLTKAELTKMIDSGEWKVTQITNIGEEALKASMGDLITNWRGGVEFVVSKNVRTAPLDFKQIPYRPGGHVELDDGFFVRQAVVTATKFDNATLHSYSGDRNLFHFVSKKEGERVIKNLEKARVLYKEARDTKNKAKLIELRQFLNKSNLPYSFNTFTKMFKGKEATYSLDQPFYLTHKNESIEAAHKISKNYSNFINRNESVYNLYNQGVNLKWAGERNDYLKTVINSGSTLAPSYKLSKARHIDAITTLERATSNMLKDPYISEYKHVAAERFIAEFGDVLEGDITLNPFKALIDGKFKESTKTNKDLLAAAKGSRRATLEFLGMKDDFGKNWDYQRAKLWQKLIDRQGEAGAQKLLDNLDWADGWTYGAIKDPVRAMRAFAFHTKLGLFNPVQLFLQAQTMAHVVAVAGVNNGARGSMSIPFQWAAMLAPQHADAILDKAFVMGWKKGELKEATEWGRKTGWFRVGQEVAVRDDYINAPLVETRFGRFLDTGTMFFREGERTVRMAAWNAAYLEWRSANPTRTMTNATAKQILNRADLFSVNMTAASNASWQKGFKSIPTQFFAYQARLSEQFLGKRLTRAEKAQAFMTYGAIYGLPVATGTYTGIVWPFHETIREMLIDKGIDVDDNIAYKTMHDGLFSMAVEAATGEKFNVGERYGPGGLPFMEDLLSGDKSILEAFGGVSGTTIADLIKATEPFTYSALSAMDPNSEWYPVTSEDLNGLLKVASSGRQFSDLMNAINIGRYVSKNGTPIDDMTGFEGAMKALFGLTPSRISDTYRILENTKERTEYYKKGIKAATTELRKAFDRNLSVEEQQDYIKRASHLMHVVYGLDPNQVSQVWRNASKGYEMAVQGINWDYAQQSPEHMRWYEKQQAKKKAQ